MEKTDNKKEAANDKRRKRLQQRAHRLEEQKAEASGLDDEISAVYRRMSNIAPDAFVVVVKCSVEGRDNASVYGVSHRVSRGIDTDGLSFRLERAHSDGHDTYLLLETDGMCCGENPRLTVHLVPGQRVGVTLGRGSFPTRLGIFFTLSKKEANQFAKQQRGDE